MPNGRVFNKSIVESYATLKNFLSQSDAIEQVLSKKDTVYTKSLIAREPFFPWNSSLPWRWRACQFVTFPLRAYLQSLLHGMWAYASGIYQLTSLEAAHRLAKVMMIGERRLNAGFAYFSDEPTKVFSLKTAVNRTNSQGNIIRKTPAIPRASITDPKIKKRTYLDGIGFNFIGYCWGMSVWLIYLYLKTRSQFTDPRAHMAALGQQFTRGAGMDPALLQCIYLRKGKLLGLKIGTQPKRAHAIVQWPLVSGACTALVQSLLGIPLFEQKPSEWNSSSEEIVRKLQTLPPGAYAVGVPKHGTAYIKINDRLGYFFDPNEGITEIQGDKVGEKLHGLISEVIDYCPKSGYDTSLGKAIWMVQVSPVTLR